MEQIENSGLAIVMPAHLVGATAKKAIEKLLDCKEEDGTR
jgi:hypothetical protein